MKCPVCGANDLTESSEFCRNCGKILVRCSECSSLNVTQVEFCVKCGGRLTKTYAEHSSSDGECRPGEPYVVWKGFPFATLEKKSQSKRQFSVSLLFFVAAFAVTIALCSIRLLEETGLGETVCFLTLMIFLFVAGMFVYWWSGREGATEAKKEKES